MTCNLWEQKFSSKQKALTLTRKKTTCHTKSPTRPRRKCYSRRLKSGRIYIRICQSVGEQKFYLTKRRHRNNMISVAAAAKIRFRLRRERSRATPVAYNSKSNRPAAASRHVAHSRRGKRASERRFIIHVRRVINICASVTIHTCSPRNHCLSFTSCGQLFLYFFISLPAKATRLRERRGKKDDSSLLATFAGWNIHGARRFDM